MVLVTWPYFREMSRQPYPQLTGLCFGIVLQQIQVISPGEWMSSEVHGEMTRLLTVRVGLQYLTLLANSFQDSQGSGLPKADIICLDVERMLTEDRDILKLKTNAATPAKYASLV